MRNAIRWMPMRKTVLVLTMVVVAGAGIAWYRSAPGSASAQTETADRQAAGPGRAGPRGAGAGAPGQAAGRPPMTVELATASRGTVVERVMVVGNLTGAATVAVSPKVAGRLDSVLVRIGDRVTSDSVIAQVDDREIREQVKQAEASFQVAQATIRQREADQRFAETNLDRSKNLFERQLLPRQTLDDAEARAQAASAQLDLAHAQFDQAKARLDELRITLANTTILSPVDGYVGKRYVDPGAYVSSNTPVVEVVDIHLVRLVANLVEKDVSRITAGTPAVLDVDAFPGETFSGTVARVAPVLDPATRTATMEVEIPNRDLRLRPGMYGRIQLSVGARDNATVVPRNALTDIGDRRGLFVVGESGDSVSFVPVEPGIIDGDLVEIPRGIAEGTRVVTTGAAGLRDGDRIVEASVRVRGAGGARESGGGQRESSEARRTDRASEARRPAQDQ